MKGLTDDRCLRFVGRYPEAAVRVTGDVRPTRRVARDRGNLGLLGRTPVPPAPKPRDRRSRSLGDRGRDGLEERATTVAARAAVLANLRDDKLLLRDRSTKMHPEKEPCPSGARAEQQVFGTLGVPRGARLQVPDPVHADPFVLGVATVRHAQGFGHELVERLRGDELQRAVAAAVGDPLGKDAEFHAR